MAAEPAFSSGTKMHGLVLDIHRFAIHDGPGIRTLVLMKGCPLRCLWCSTPESQATHPEIMYFDLYCKKCGRCLQACLLGAISLSTSDRVVLNRKICTQCGQCVEECSNNALRIAGSFMTAAQLLAEVQKDQTFYRRSQGGITVGGGEPTAQSQFVTAFLRMCKEKFLQTALETCAYTKWENLEQILPYVDLLYVDIKHMDAVAHKRITGVSNRVILHNVEKAARFCKIIIRLPTVPGLNDTEENIRATALFAGRLKGLQRLELLPYHQFGVPKYRRLGRRYKLDGLHPPGEEHMESCLQIAESCGINVRIGG